MGSGVDGSAAIRWAQRHEGLVTREQALGLGVSDKLLTGMVAKGMLIRAHQGVYLLAGAHRSPVTRVRAGLAAAGGSALASHRSAAWLAGLIDTPPGTVEVTVIGSSHRQVPGVHVHRSNVPPRARSFQGVRCTDVPRTLVDLAATAGDDKLAVAVDRALARGTTRVQDLLRELDAGSRRGSRALRDCLSRRGDFCIPDASVLESQMARLLLRHGVPIPEAEVRAGPGGCYRIDYAYRQCRLAVELYGFAWHHSPGQMTRDLARQRQLVLQGWRVLIYTWWDVVVDGGRVATEIFSALHT